MLSSEFDSDFEIDEEFMKDAFEYKSVQTSAEICENKTINGNSFRNNVINDTSKTTAKGKVVPPIMVVKQNSCIQSAEGPSPSCVKATDRRDSPKHLVVEENKLIPSTRSSLSYESRVLVSGSTVLPSTPKILNLANKVVRQRKFPGPAGLLPDVKMPDCSVNTSMLNNSESTGDVNPFANTEAVNCSQNSTISGMQAAPWRYLSADYHLSPGTLLANYNVAWVKRRATSRQLVGRKVPFLAVVLKHIDYFSTDPSVVLEDKTGTINGTLHRDVLEEYASQLKPGSALVLHQMGVVSTGFPTRRHYLNITLNNINSIYDCPSEESDRVRVTNVKNIPLDQLELLINRSESQNQSYASSFVASPNNTVLNRNSEVPRLFSHLNVVNKNDSNNKAVEKSLSTCGFVQASSASSFKPKVSFDSKRDNNAPSPIPISTSTVQKNKHNIYTDTPRCGFTPKVARMSVSTTVTSSVPNSPAPTANTSATDVPEVEHNIVESIFQGFDCSSLFEDF